MTEITDVTVENHGSVFIFQPHTDAAKKWIEDNVQVEGWQWIGGGLAVEPRCARDLADGMLRDGLIVK
jgi:hypothetical protein